MFDANQLEPALTAQETLLRDHFVCEYLKDFDAMKACMRLGFLSTFADMWQSRLMKDGYVQRKIAHMTRVPVDSPEQQAIDKATVENTLRTVMHRGSDSARVAAAREFNAMRGWSKPDAGAEGEEALIAAFKDAVQALPS